jgi:hypothetical protein
MAMGRPPHGLFLNNFFLKIDLEILDGAKVAGRLPATFYASLVRIG